MRFREYFLLSEEAVVINSESNFVQFITEAFEQTPVPEQLKPKPWSAKKSEIMQMWRQINPNLPIIMTPMHKSSEGKTRSYGEDGIRITGSWQFIASIIGRLKELLFYENPKNKLRLIFKGIDSSKNARADRQSFVFYVNSQSRGKGA